MISNDYNNRVCSKLVDYIKFFVERIEASVEDTSIKVTKYQVIDTNNFDINYLTIHGLTGTLTIKLYFEVTKGGVKSTFDEDIEVPKMINNVFVIEGTLRVPTNTLDNSGTLTVYDNNIRVNDVININYQEDEHQPNGYLLTINIYEDEEPLVIEGTVDNFSKYSNYLKLTEAEADKLKVKLDTDDVKDTLTYDHVIKLIELGSDKLHDNMIDKVVYSAESNLMQYMWSRDIRKKILTSIKSKYYQYNHIYLKDIQNAINRYFVVASEKNIDFPTSVNPLVFDAMKSKIIIPKNVAYNDTMMDIIDVANTPINTNTNRINELNVCTSIKDDVIYIKCYKYPSQEPVEVPYTHYCTKKVLINQFWDYDLKNYKNQNDPVKYKLRLKFYTGSTGDSYDYIEPKPDDKLSVTTRRIPLGNISDSVRIAMATSMVKQAVELDGSEVPLVSTGLDETDLQDSTLHTKYNNESEATVTKIQDNKIFIKDNSTGSVTFYEVPSPTPAMDDSIISFDTVVKPGDTIKKGDVLIKSHMFRNNAFELGTNVNVVYMNYLGYTHEDGCVISESLSKRLTHYSIMDVYQYLYPDDIIRFIKPVGSVIKSKDILVNNQTKLRVSSTLKDVYVSDTGLLSGLGISYNQNNLTVPNNIELGYVLDCKIHIEDGRELTNDLTKETIFKYGKDGKVNDYEEIPDKYKSLHANDLEMLDKAVGYISYKLIRVDRGKVGDKLTNRYGGKGIISLVLPDECMPQIVYPDGTRVAAEEILNPAGVLHRLNMSQVYECGLTKCIEGVYRHCDGLIKVEKIDEAKKFLEQFRSVYKDKFIKLSNDEYAKLHNSKGLQLYVMDVGFYSKVNYTQILAWMKLLGIKETERIFCPDIVIVETGEGIKGVNPDKYVKQLGDKAKHHELGWCENECITGREYIMKLWMNPAYYGKVTSEILDSNEPFMGKGFYRGEGQKIGEMELWVLIGSGIEKFVQDQSESMKTSQYQFLNELLLSGYFIQDKEGNALLSPDRSKHRALENLK